MLILWRWEWIRADDRWDLRLGDVDQLQRLHRIYLLSMSRPTRTLCKCWCWWRCWYCVCRWRWCSWPSWYCRECIHRLVTLNENFVQMLQHLHKVDSDILDITYNPPSTMVRLPRTLCKSWFFYTSFSQALGLCILCEYSFISINTLESVMHISSQSMLSGPETWWMIICFNCLTTGWLAG